MAPPSLFNLTPHLHVRLTQYFVGEARLVIADAAGRMVTSLELVEGGDQLPISGPGVYFIRFPFSKEVIRYIGR